MSVKRQLEEEFNRQREEISNLTLGTEEYKIAMDGLNKLAERIIEIEKAEADHSFKTDVHFDERIQKVEEMASAKRDQNLKNAILIGTTVGGWAMAWLIHMSSMKYDKDGVLPTLPGGRFATNFLLNFKK